MCEQQWMVKWLDSAATVTTVCMTFCQNFGWSLSEFGACSFYYLRGSFSRGNSACKKALIWVIMGWIKPHWWGIFIKCKGGNCLPCGNLPSTCFGLGSSQGFVLVWRPGRRDSEIENDEQHCVAGGCGTGASCKDVVWNEINPVCHLPAAPPTGCLGQSTAGTFLTEPNWI